MLNIHLDKSSPVPYYFQIEEALRGLISSGVLTPGDMLPSELTLGTQLDVSRITIRQALKDLTNEGLLVRKRAIGTFVAYPRRVVPIVRDRLRGLTEELSTEGYTVRSQVLEHVLIPASGEVMKELQLSYKDQVIKIRRLRFMNTIPLVIETSHHPYTRFPELLRMDLTDRSTYEILDKEFHACPVEARDRFVADIASKEEAVLLDIDPGDPVMRYRRTARDREGNPMEFTLSIYRADQYQFVIHYRSDSSQPDKGGDAFSPLP